MNDLFKVQESYQPSFSDTDKSQIINNLTVFKTEAERFLKIKNKNLIIKKEEKIKNQKKFKKFLIKFQKQEKNYENFEKNKISNRNNEPLINEVGEAVDVDNLVAEMSLNACENLFNIYAELSYDEDETLLDLDTQCVKINVDADHIYSNDDYWHKSGDDVHELTRHLSKYEKIMAVMQEIDTVEIERFHKLNNNVFYWKIKDYLSEMPEILRVSIETKLNPMHFLGMNQLNTTSASILRELNLYFDILVNESSDKNVTLGKLFYLGDNSVEFNKFTKNISRDKVEIQNCRSDSTWRERNVINKTNIEYNYLDTFESNLQKMFSQEKENEKTVMFIDWDCIASNKTAAEQERGYDVFKQLYMVSKYSSKGSKLVLKVPSIYYAFTRELLSTFALLFEKVQIIKPSTSLLGSECSYMCFDEKKFDGLGIMNTFFDLNLVYYESIHKRNLKVHFQKYILKHVLLLTTEYLMNDTYIYLTDFKLDVLRYMFCTYKIIFKMVYENKTYEVNPFLEDKGKLLSYPNLYYQIMTKSLRVHDSLESNLIMSESLVFPELENDILVDPSGNTTIATATKFSFKYLENLFSTILQSTSSLSKSYLNDVQYDGKTLNDLLILYNQYYLRRNGLTFKHHERLEYVKEVELKLRLNLLNKFMSEAHIVNLQDVEVSTLNNLEMLNAYILEASVKLVGNESVLHNIDKKSLKAPVILDWNTKKLIQNGFGDGKKLESCYEVEQKVITMFEEFNFYFNDTDNSYDLLRRMVYENNNIIIGTFIDEESKQIDDLLDFENNGRLFKNNCFSKARKKYFQKLSKERLLSLCDLAEVHCTIMSYKNLNNLLELTIDFTLKDIMSEKYLIVIFPTLLRFNESVMSIINNSFSRMNKYSVPLNSVPFKYFPLLHNTEILNIIIDDYDGLVRYIRDLEGIHKYKVLARIFYVMITNQDNRCVEYAKQLIIILDAHEETFIYKDMALCLSRDNIFKLLKTRDFYDEFINLKMYFHDNNETESLNIVSDDESDTLPLLR